MPSQLIYFSVLYLLSLIHCCFVSLNFHQMKHLNTTPHSNIYSEVKNKFKLGDPIVKELKVGSRGSNTLHQKIFLHWKQSNQIKSFIILAVLRRIKCVESLRHTLPHHCALATQLLSKKCHSDGELLATLCPTRPPRDLNLRLPAPEANALPFVQLARIVETVEPAN